MVLTGGLRRNDPRHERGGGTVLKKSIAMKLFWTLISILFLMSGRCAASRHHPRAFDQPTIQAGIDAAVSGDTVLVADGTWTGDGNRDIDFMGKAITVASENGPESCIVDCDATEVDHHRGFYFHRGEGRGSLLVGFTIEKGFVGGASASGGGILCEGASPVIQGNVIRVNTSDSKDIQGEGGGGIACFSASPLISGNVISSNLTNGLNGGGIFCEDGSAPIITGNTIEGNIVNTYGGHGGGIYARRSLMVIRRNIIRNNDSGISGNCIYCQLCETEILGNQITENRVRPMPSPCGNPPDPSLPTFFPATSVVSRFLMKTFLQSPTTISVTIVLAAFPSRRAHR